MAGSRGSTTTTAEIPDELKPLITSTASQLMGLQGRAPVGPFADPALQFISNLSPAEGSLIQSIYGTGAAQGPSFQEGQALLSGQAGLQNAYQPVSTMNTGDRLGLQSLSNLTSVAGQPIAAPSSDQDMFRALSGAFGVTQTPYGYTGTTEAENQALGGLGHLANQDPADFTALEGQAVNQLGGLYGLSQADLPNLSTPEFGALGALGGLSQLNQQQAGGATLPELQGLGLLGETAGLNRANLSTFYGPEYQALATLQPFVGGELGQSPATLAAMEAYRTQVQPAVQSQLALRGLSNSGAAAEALAQAETSAYIPLVQQELQQRMQAVPMLQSMGATIGDRERTDLARQLATGSQLGAQFSDVGSRLGERGMADLARQLQFGGQFAGQAADIGARMSDRDRMDLARALEFGRGISGDIADLGGREADRARQDLAQQIQAYSNLAGFTGDQANRLAQTELAQRNQQFGQLADLGRQYQSVSDMLYGRDVGAIERQMAAYQAAAPQLFQYGTDVAGREAQSRDLATNAAFQLANLQQGIGADVAGRDFDQMLTALNIAGLPRQIADQQAQAAYDDFARRQALSEQALLAPISSGVLTSGIGQNIGARQSGLIPGVYK